MKHIIEKIEYITGDTRLSEKVNIETTNLEAERKKLYTEHPCDVVYFTYVSLP